MGVPRFFRYLCKRYPCILKLINEYQIPEFDNLYLDMNGIVHMCSHPNNGDASFRISEEDIFKNIFQYTENLFNMIKPQKLFFISVDGVAPRAKINQQRARRFRAAKEAAEAEERAKARGEVLPEENKFDSNCITPGTAFMARLSEQLKYFITWKVSTNKLWQKCKIIFSGSEVPGEGEHKIMDYIRHLKAQPDYDPCTRHCLYGSDADLIVLGLSTHELYFSVLREEVDKTRDRKRKRSQKTEFCILQNSLLREYIELEFLSLKDKIKFPFDTEKIIDDWILMGFLVGNDFIPNLPNLHIDKGALHLLFEVYKEVLPTLDGYINEAGTLNLERFEIFMEKLSQIDVNRFVDQYADLKYFEEKTGRRPNEKERTSYRKNSESPESEESPKKIGNKELNALIQSTDDMLLGHSDEEEPLESDSSSDMYNIEFLQHKRDYYMNKLEYESVDADVLRSQSEAYVTALQWNLNYYYNGCCSWSWHYPHHYAPYISDIKGFKDLKIEFSMGEPFLPFQQLLSVLPAANKDLVPEVYQCLMTNEDSPIIDYYPTYFNVDFNEKRQVWEAIVLIPIIDEKRLLEAMSPYDDKLTAEERERNKRGPMSIITYTEENLGIYKAPQYFPSIESHAKIVEIFHDDILIPKEKLVKGLCKAAQLNAYCPGFPTFKFIQHTVKFEECKVIDYKNELGNVNLIVEIAATESPNLHDVGKKMLGKTVFVNWPYLHEALVTGVANSERKISLLNMDQDYHAGNARIETFNSNLTEIWNSKCTAISESYSENQCIDIGPTKVLIYAKPLVGKQYELVTNEKMVLVKKWSPNPLCYAYQTIVIDIPLIKQDDQTSCGISDIFTVKSVVFMLGHPHYGAMGEIIEPGVNPKNGRIKVAMKIETEPDLKEIKREYMDFESHRWMPTNIAAQRLGVSNNFMSRITGSIFVTPDSLETPSASNNNRNIGLNLKFTKRNEEMPGYTRKLSNHWLYSTKAVNLIKNYMEKFPLLFERLVVPEDEYLESNLFKNGTETLAQVLNWLKEQLESFMDIQSCDFDGLDVDTIKSIQEQVDKSLENHSCDTGKTVLMQVKPHLLYKPDLQAGNMPPDPKARHKVFDRIINVRENSLVPLGLKGTIVGIQASEDKTTNTYVVLFDKKLIGLRCIPTLNKINDQKYGMLEAEFINISHGVREEVDMTSLSLGLGSKKLPLTLEPPKSWRNRSTLPTPATIAPPPKSWRQEPQINAGKQSQSNFEAFASLYSSKSIPLPSFCQNPKGNDVEIHNQQVNPSKKEISLQNRQQNLNIGQKTMKQQPLSLSKVQRVGKDSLQGKMTIEKMEMKKIGQQQMNYQQQDRSSEFQLLWNELHKPSCSGNGNGTESGIFTQKPMGPPGMSLSKQLPVQSAAISGDSLQDESAFLKAMLKISDKSSNSSSQTNTASLTTNKTIVGASLSSNNPSSAPPLVQQMFDHARQARSKENVSYCTKLLTHSQLIGQGMPRYNYLINHQKMVCAQIILPDMRTYCGEFCGNHAEATESAAKVVCKELNLDGAGTKPGVNILGAPPAMWLNSRHGQVQHPPQPHNSGGGPPVASMMHPPPPPPSMMQRSSQSPQVLPNMHEKSPRAVLHSVQRTSNDDKLRNDNKTQGKNKKTTSFVPLQAQKRTRTPKAKQTPRSLNQTNKDQNLSQGLQATKSNSETQKVTNNEKLLQQQQQPQQQLQQQQQQQASLSSSSLHDKKECDAKKCPQTPQKPQKTPRQRRSRVAAKFNSMPPANGNNVAGPQQ